MSCESGLLELSSCGGLFSASGDRRACGLGFMSGVRYNRGVT